MPTDIFGWWWLSLAHSLLRSLKFQFQQELDTTQVSPCCGVTVGAGTVQVTHLPT